MLFKIQMHNKIILECFEKHKCPGTTILFQISRCIPSKQSCLKKTGLYDDLLLLSSLFHIFYFIFSALTLFSLCFLISPFLLLLLFSLKPLSSVVEKLLYTYICSMYNIYFRKCMNFCPAKTIYDILMPLAWLNMNRMLDF